MPSNILNQIIFYIKTAKCWVQNALRTYRRDYSSERLRGTRSARCYHGEVSHRFWCATIWQFFAMDSLSVDRFSFAFWEVWKQALIWYHSVFSRVSIKILVIYQADVCITSIHLCVTPISKKGPDSVCRRVTFPFCNYSIQLILSLIYRCIHSHFQCCRLKLH